MANPQWVMLVYRLPRTPSTPRISLWRRLRRLGVAQIVDGVVALPASADTREQLEWLADEVVQADGEATIWIAEPATAAQGRALARAMTDRVDGEYTRVGAEAAAAHAAAPAERRRTLARLRRELRRIEGRRHFPTPVEGSARAAVEALAKLVSEQAA
jgi:hypothetical protein